MAISYVGAVSGNNINGGNVTLDLSGLGLAQGDIVLLAGSLPVTSGGGTSSSGWTSISTDYGSSFGRGTLLYKFMGPSPDTSVVGLGSGDASDGTAWIAVAFRGTEPSQTSFGFGSATTGTGQPNPPSVSVPVNDCAVVVLGHYVGSNVHDTSVTQPSGYTLAGNNSGNDTDDAVVAAAYLLGVAAGSEDPGAWSNFTTNALNAFGIGATIYLAPRSTALELDADGGTYALTGSTATVRRTRKAIAAGSSYAQSGSAATLKRSRLVAASGAAYSVTGSAADLDIQASGAYTISAGTGSYSLGGAAAALRIARKVSASAGSHLLSPSDAGLRRALILSASPASYAVSGADADLVATGLPPAGAARVSIVIFG